MSIVGSTRGSSVVEVTVNGKVRSLAPGTSLSDVLADLGVGPGRGGVAVAIDDAVVPAGRWEVTRLGGGERVEVLGAVSGG